MTISISMLQLIIIVSALVGLSILLLGINIFIFGRKFPETEVGKNRHMIQLAIRCPHCEERKMYNKSRQARINFKDLQPDWNMIKG
jgi:hypothetical protein